MAEEKLTYKFQHLSEVEKGEVVLPEARQISVQKTVTFSLNEIIGDITAFDRKLKELEGMRVVNAAKVTNVTRQHPFVLDLSEADLMAAYLYQESKSMVAQTEKHIAAILNEKKMALAEVADIKAQIPELADVPVVSEPLPTDANTQEASSEEAGGANTQADESQEAKQAAE